MSLDHPAITDSFSLPSNGGSGDAAAPAHEWTTHSAPDGTRYYYNAHTRTSRWERPAEMDGNAASRVLLTTSTSQHLGSACMTERAAHGLERARDLQVSLDPFASTGLLPVPSGGQTTREIGKHRNVLVTRSTDGRTMSEGVAKNFTKGLLGKYNGPRGLASGQQSAEPQGAATSVGMSRGQDIEAVDVAVVVVAPQHSQMVKVDCGRWIVMYGGGRTRLFFGTMERFVGGGMLARNLHKVRGEVACNERHGGVTELSPVVAHNLKYVMESATLPHDVRIRGRRVILLGREMTPLGENFFVETLVGDERINTYYEFFNFEVVDALNTEHQLTESKSHDDALSFARLTAAASAHSTVMERTNVPCTAKRTGSTQTKESERHAGALHTTQPPPDTVLSMRTESEHTDESGLCAGGETLRAVQGERPAQCNARNLQREKSAARNLKREKTVTPEICCEKSAAREICGDKPAARETCSAGNLLREKTAAREICGEKSEARENCNARNLL